MNAPAKGKIKDPLTTVLFDLQNLKDDIAYLVDGVPSFKSLDAMCGLFITGIQNTLKERNR